MIHPFTLAVVAAMAYGTNSVIAKHALDNMHVYIYVFVIALVYMVVAAILLMVKGREIVLYFKTRTHHKYIAVAVAAVLIGTVFADAMTWSALRASPPERLPIVSALINMSPLFTLVLVSLVFGVRLNATSIIGVVLITLGCVAVSISEK
jgi:drug/metabolite transporter (DMT)-like permease